MPKAHYLDYNGTTPLDAKVLQAMLPFLGPQFGNASSSHPLGVAAKAAVSRARQQIGAMLEADAPEEEVAFMSGGTETINYALKGSATAALRATGRNHIITSAVEHVAVLETCKFLETTGFQVTYLPVDQLGRVHVSDVLAAVTSQTFLVTIMLANNEVGTLQPVAEIARAVKRHVDESPELRHSILVHTDASQAVGKVPVSVRELGVDMLTIAGQKLYAPKGIGALYIRKGTLEPDVLIHGASQEHGRRAGTENVPYVVALGAACELVHERLPEYQAVMQEGKQFLLENLLKLCSLSNISYRVNGHPELSLPNTLSISFADISAVRLLNCTLQEQLPRAKCAAY